MQQGLLFASARAKAKENNLFTEERLYRVLEARTLKDAVRILAEANYGGGANVTVENFYDVLAEEERLASEFLREAAPKGMGIECFFLLKDYHNLKVMIKAEYTGNKEYEKMLLRGGLYSTEELKDRLDSGKLNSFMDEAVKRIKKTFETGEPNPRIIDVELDKAAYREIMSILNGKNADKYVKDYFVTSIDAINIGSLLRTIKIGESIAFFEYGFIEGGEIGREEFRDCNCDEGKLAKLVEKTRYKPMLDTIKSGALVEFETAKDNCLLRIFSANKADMFSVAPAVGYYLGKMNEVKVLRVALVCIKNGVKRDEMKRRVRALYA